MQYHKSYQGYKNLVKEAIFSEVFSVYGARAYRIIDELLSLEMEDIHAFLKDWNLFNAQIKGINEKLNSQSQEFLSHLSTNTDLRKNDLSNVYIRTF